jgi:hypothetical protein
MMEARHPIKVFDSPHDALLARGALEANGIHAVLRWDRVASKVWLPGDHQIVLLVSERDVSAAQAFFSEAEAIAKLHARAHCPRCGGTALTRLTLRRIAAFAWLRGRAPLLQPRAGWRCGTCGRFSEAVIR